MFSCRLLDIHLAGGGDQGRPNLSALSLLERQVGYLGARRVGKDCPASHAHDWAQYQPEQSVRQPKLKLACRHLLDLRVQANAHQSTAHYFIIIQVSTRMRRSHLFFRV